MKMKKVLCATIASTMMLGMTGMAFAGDMSMYSESVGNVSIVAADTVDPSVVERFETGVVATIVNEDGTETPADVVVTIKELPISRAAQNGDIVGKSYAITAESTAKIISDNADWNKKDATASQTLTMEWTDVSGLRNTIDNLQGEVTITEGTLDRAMLEWGNPNAAPVKKIDVGTSFDFPVYYTSNNGATGGVYAELNSYFVGVNGSLKVRVNPFFIN